MGITAVLDATILKIEDAKLALKRQLGRHPSFYKFSASVAPVLTDNHRPDSTPVASGPDVRRIDMFMENMMGVTLGRLFPRPLNIDRQP